MTTNSTSLMMILVTVCVAPVAHLTAATVDYVKGKATAATGAKLPRGATFGTGPRSLSQVGMERSFFRVGSDSQVKLGEGRRIVLEKGVMLVGSEPGGRRREVEVEAPGYRLKVKGTVQVAYYPGQYLKITVLEGAVTVALQSLTGEFETLKEGQMLIINPSDKRLPDPVEVDLTRLVSTSQLVNTPFGMPSTKGLIDSAAAAQGNDFRVGDIARTPFLLRGASPEVTLVRQEAQAATAGAKKAAGGERNGTTSASSLYLVDNAAGGRVLTDETSVFQVVNDLADPSATVNQKTYADGVSFYSFPFPPSTTDVMLSRIDSATGQPVGARTRELTVLMTSEPDSFGGYAGPARLHGTIRADPDLFGNVSGKMLIFESQEFGADPFNDYSLHVDPGTDILTPPGVGLRLLGALGLTIESASLQAGGASAADELLDLRATERDITVIGSVLKGNDVSIAGSTANTGADQNIIVDSTIIAAKNNAAIGLPAARSNITIQNSTQLSALVGSITVQSKGGPITVDTSTLNAGGTVTIDALDPADANAAGIVNITNANLSADVIRARGSSPSGDGLVIDGGTFNAASMLKFYAEGASTLRFRNAVNVNTPLAIFAGKTVRVDAGGSVTVSGRADVHADTHQYNSAGNGTISAGGGLNAFPHASRPGF